MTLQQARHTIRNELCIVYDSSEAANVTELVLEKITGLDKTARLVQKEYSLTILQQDTLKKITERLKKNEPVQYVLEEAWFAGIKLKVNPSVLIPRPETEELVDWIVKDLSCRPENRIFSGSILDIGTGSGCIPIALKKKFPQATLTAMDVCSEALSVARENAISHHAEINFQLLDFLQEENWTSLNTFDLLVSNPPYIRRQESSTMHPRVTMHEPHRALFVPDEDALIFYNKLAGFALHHLPHAGSIYVEIHEALGKEVTGLFQKKGFYTELKKDMQGKDRMVKAVNVKT